MLACLALGGVGCLALAVVASAALGIGGCLAPSAPAGGAGGVGASSAAATFDPDGGVFVPRPPAPGEESQGSSLVGAFGEGVWQVTMPQELGLHAGTIVSTSGGDPFAIKGTLFDASFDGHAVKLRIDGIRKITPASETDAYLANLSQPAQTLLYTVSASFDQQRWSPLCRPDRFGDAEAVPVAGWWDATGALNKSPTVNVSVKTNATAAPRLFTFGCLAGVIAKCYKWNYQPWQVPDATAPDQMSDVHWACTRLARADYCGDGAAHTIDNTPVDVWDVVTSAPVRHEDSLPPPPPWPPITFEAGWGTLGALCITHARWKSMPPGICAMSRSALFGNADCRDRPQQPHFCDTQDEAVTLSKQLLSTSAPMAEPLYVFNASNSN